MSGHSKWSKIKHKKAKEDAKKGKVFTRLIREITVAAREGGGNPVDNARLRLLMEKAKAANMPQDNVVRAIKKGTGELEGVMYEHALYEGYGPGGIAVIVETLSDNKKRTISAVRHVFSKMGGNLAEAGSVIWMFDQKGVLVLQGKDLKEDEVLEKLLNYDVEDIKRRDDTIFVICDVANLEAIKREADRVGFVVESADVEWIAKNDMVLDDASTEEKAYAFLEAVEEVDDVQNVYTNLN